MCVKEFHGYNCGHCSVPRLRKCPIASADVNYPACEHPAERPIFTNSFCHPCARVVWNKQVLETEEKHRIQHKNGECECEVIFDQEERERRARSVVLSKGKEREYEARGHGNNGFAGRGQRGRGFSRGSSLGAGHQRGGLHGGGGEYQGNGEGSSGFGNGRGNNDFRRGNSFRGTRQIGFQQGPEFVAEQFDPAQGPYNFGPDLKSNVHQYHGYNGDGPVPGHDTPTGYAAHIHPTPGFMGQPGVGWKWFDVEPPLPPLLQLPPGTTLPPLPVPLTATQQMVYQNPIHSQVVATQPWFQAPVSETYGQTGYTGYTYTGYQVPVNGPGLVYQKAASEPSNNIESPQSAGSEETGYATAMSNGDAHSLSADNNAEVPMTMDTDFSTPKMTTKTLTKNVEGVEYHHHLEQQTENLVLSNTRSDDAGEGRST